MASGPIIDNTKEPVKLVASQKSEEEIAKEFITEIEALMVPVCAVFDRAAAAGLTILWDGVSPTPPTFKHKVTGVRITKTYMK